MAIAVLAVVAGALAAGQADATFPGRDGKLVLVRGFGRSAPQVYIGDRTGRLRLLSRGFAYAAGPSVSPDGRLIAFRARRNPDSVQQIWLVKPNGSGLRQLTHNRSDGTGPAFSADGRYILYDSFDSDPEGGETAIWRVNLRTGVERPLLGIGPRSPAISPRGKIFVFVDQSHTDFSELYTARMDGSRIKRLTHEPYFAEQPDISPNGRWIVYRTLRPCAGRGYRNAIVAINPTGTKSRVLVKDCRFGLGAPVFSPNGHLVVYFRQGVARTITFPRPGASGHLLRQRPPRAVDSNLAWQAG